jgi:preprotein translocase subunit SecY
LQKQGGFIPGIRPGRPTSDYLNMVMNRVVLVGAIFLGLIAILPNIIPSVTNVATIAFGGTSLLIVVSVAIETVKQIDAQLVMRDYEGF